MFVWNLISAVTSYREIMWCNVRCCRNQIPHYISFHVVLLSTSTSVVCLYRKQKRRLHVNKGFAWWHITLSHNFSMQHGIWKPHYIWHDAELCLTCSSLILQSSRLLIKGERDDIEIPRSHETWEFPSFNGLAKIEIMLGSRNVIRTFTD